MLIQFIAAFSVLSITGSFPQSSFSASTGHFISISNSSKLLDVRNRIPTIFFLQTQKRRTVSIATISIQFFYQIYYITKINSKIFLKQKFEKQKLFCSAAQS
eukprot:TRINITY_DN645_c1_g2_i1.p4 TRINITY_DN645_c1_g2~~TRINITY_DN645_c1_g2_i1.p4  ORF type:complete len:102 (-),score=2.19 TRINITY_DN645_c1_g2_i1:121-426(-)